MKGQGAWLHKRFMKDCERSSQGDVLPKYRSSYFETERYCKGYLAVKAPVELLDSKAQMNC